MKVYNIKCIITEQTRNKGRAQREAAWRHTHLTGNTTRKLCYRKDDRAMRAI